MTDAASIPSPDNGPLLRTQRPFVSFLRPAPLVIAGCAVSVVVGLATFLGLRTPTEANRPAIFATGQDDASRTTLLDALPKTYGEATQVGPAEGDAAPLPAPRHLSSRGHDPDGQRPSPGYSSHRTFYGSRGEGLFFGEPGRFEAQRSPSGVTHLAEPVLGLGERDAEPIQQIGEKGAAPPRAQSPVEAKASSPRLTTLRAGDFINAALLTALDSEIPGTVVAQVTRNVFDHATGRMLIIPQGARLVGKYEGRPPFGQRRAVITWREIIMPDGGSLDLGSMAGTDSTGASGVEDSVDTHITPIMRAIALSTALTVGGAAAQSANSRSSGGFVLNDAASGVSTRASEVGQRFVDRDLNQAPTLRIRPGWPVAIIVEHDLAVPGYNVAP